MVGQPVNVADKPKSITFLDSLNGTGAYTSKLNDYEDYLGNRKFGGQYAASTIPTRKYMFYNKPKQGQSYRSSGHTLKIVLIVRIELILTICLTVNIIDVVSVGIIH